MVYLLLNLTDPRLKMAQALLFFLLVPDIIKHIEKLFLLFLLYFFIYSIVCTILFITFCTFINEAVSSFLIHYV